MTRDEFSVRSREILTKLESPEDVGAIIDVLDGAFGERDTAASEAEARIAELEAKNERLQKANMELFLRTGVQGETNDLEGVEEEKEVDFQELFADDGELK